MSKFTAPVEVRQDDKWRRLLTHIEIRRAQNGFIVMGINMAQGVSYQLAAEAPDKVVFVCETPESLCNTIAALTTLEGDYCWQPSVDVPITDLFAYRRAKE